MAILRAFEGIWRHKGSSGRMDKVVAEIVPNTQPALPQAHLSLLQMNASSRRKLTDDQSTRRALSGSMSAARDAG